MLLEKSSISQWHVSRNLYKKQKSITWRSLREERPQSVRWITARNQGVANYSALSHTMWKGQENCTAVSLSQGTEAHTGTLMPARANGKGCTWSPLREGTNLSSTKAIEQSNWLYPKKFMKALQRTCVWLFFFFFLSWVSKNGRSHPSEDEETIPDRVNHTCNCESFWKLQDLIYFKNGEKSKTS